jgi:DNA repair exonuclease SbcCD ATPase subunit
MYSAGWTRPPSQRQRMGWYSSRETQYTRGRNSQYADHDLQYMIDKERRRASFAENKLRQMKVELDNTAQALTNVEAERKHAYACKRDLKKLIEEKESKLHHEYSKRKAGDEKNKVLSEKISDLVQNTQIVEYLSMGQEIAKLHLKVSETEEKCNEEKGRSKHFHTKSVKLGIEKKNLEEKITNLKEANKSLNDDHKVMAERAVQRVREISQLKQRISDLEDPSFPMNQVEIKQELIEVSSKKDKVESEKSELQAQVITLHNLNITLEKDMAEVRQQFQVDAMTKRMANAAEHYQRRCKELEGQMEFSRVTLMKAEGEAKHWEQQYKITADELKCQENVVASLRVKIHEYQLSIRDETLLPRRRESGYDSSS